MTARLVRQLLFSLQPAFLTCLGVKMTNLVAAGAQGMSNTPSPRRWIELMSKHDFPRLRRELECRVLARTGNRLRNLDIQLAPDGVLIQGQTNTYYVKQLAQHGVRDLLPEVQLRNDIEVA